MRYENLFITKNTPYTKEITVLQSNGVALNLSGFTVKIVLAKHFESTVKYTFDGTVVNAANGVVQLTMSAAQTQSLPSNTLVYSVFIDPPLADQILVLQGQAFVTPTV
jgi:hypothetical protein